MCVIVSKFIFIFLPEKRLQIVKILHYTWASGTLPPRIPVRAEKTVQPCTPRTEFWVTANCCFSLSQKHWREGENRQSSRKKKSINQKSSICLGGLQVWEEMWSNASISSTLEKTEALLGSGSDIIKTTVDKEIYLIRITRSYIFDCFTLRRMPSICYIPLCSSCLQYVQGWGFW